MTGSRKERQRKEGTFLEFVKSALEDLTREMVEIKRCIKDLQASQASCCAGPYDGNAITYWDDWQAWHSLGFDGLAGMATSGIFQQPENWRDAETTIDRTSMLMYRSSSNTEPDETLPQSASDPDIAAAQHSHDEIVATPFCPGEAPSKGTELLGWRPSVTDMFREGSPLGIELLSEAASAIQEWYRNLDASPIQEDDSTSDSEGEACVKVVELTACEFKAKFFPLMSLSCILENYLQSGMKDLDEGVWYKIVPETSGPIKLSTDGSFLPQYNGVHPGSNEVDIEADLSGRAASSVEHPGVNSSSSSSDLECWDNARMMDFVKKLILILQKEESLQKKRDLIDEAWRRCECYIAPGVRDMYHNVLLGMPAEVVYYPPT